MTALLRIEARPHALEVNAGEVVALAGTPNHLVGALTGEGPGTAWLDGRPLRGGVARRVRTGLGLVRDAPVAADVAVRDHLAARTSRAEADARLDGLPLLAGRGDVPAGVLSGGERTALAWLRCQATQPRAVLLDRAGAGLDTDTFAWAGQVVAAWRQAGVAVVIVPGRPEERAWADRTVPLPDA